MKLTANNIINLNYEEILINIQSNKFDFIASINTIDDIGDIKSKNIRRFSVENNIPCITSIDIIKCFSKLLSEKIG